eukprot:GHVN01074898.1.p1 GENE.GHVN01074898.1~~GHVN01074898.1.p1  ORF type:complete len:203 (+),score=35.49 GHVN01074898.1:327-935(+)
MAEGKPERGGKRQSGWGNPVGKNFAKRRKANVVIGTAKGVLVMGNSPFLMKPAVTEALRVLKEYGVEDSNRCAESQQNQTDENSNEGGAKATETPDEKAVGENGDEVDVSKRLSEEIESVRQGKNDIFVPHLDIVKGVSFISFADETMTPSVVVRKIISAALKNPQLKCKSVFHLILQLAKRLRLQVPQQIGSGRRNMSPIS